jgi:hypothetical protein
MGYRELLLVLVSIVLLSTLMLRINSNAVEGRELVQQLELEHVAASIAQQFIEEAKSKKFDDQVGFIPPSSMPAGFTPAMSLGVEADIYPNFDDVDDYNNFTDTQYVNGIDFSPTIIVEYVQDAAPDSPVMTTTFFKRMTVSVNSNWLPGRTVTLKHVFTYFGVNM